MAKKLKLNDATNNNMFTLAVHLFTARWFLDNIYFLQRIDRPPS